jgi:hypothetical protein
MGFEEALRRIQQEEGKVIEEYEHAPDTSPENEERLAGYLSGLKFAQRVINQERADEHGANKHLMSELGSGVTAGDATTGEKE